LLVHRFQRLKLHCLHSLASDEVHHTEVGTSAQGQKTEESPGESESIPPIVQRYHEETGTTIEDLRQLFTSGLLFEIPRNDKDEWSSIGSKAHAEGECSPCIFWFRGFCKKGLACAHCHFAHPGQQSRRFKPNQRLRAAIREKAKAQEQTEQPQ